MGDREVWSLCFCFLCDERGGVWRGGLGAALSAVSYVVLCFACHVIFEHAAPPCCACRITFEKENVRDLSTPASVATKQGEDIAIGTTFVPTHMQVSLLLIC